MFAWWRRIVRVCPCGQGGGYELWIMRTKETKEKSKEEKEISFKGQIDNF
ncbi:MAG: hypothetical protein PHC29_04785 [Candidatus Omnitrophica bacterium]|nr:hypothetical protein [Candidatus Omnitrophota bacterium]